MRKFMLATALAGFMGLGGCATTNGVPTVGGISVADVVAAAKTACSFLPTAATVAGILSANPAIATAGQVAGIICAAVTSSTPASARLRAGLPVSRLIIVNGKQVIVQGTFE